MMSIQTESTLKTGPVSDVKLAIVSGGRLLMFRMAQYGLAFLSGVIVARALGPSGRAAYALPLAFTATIWVVIHLSLEAAAQRLLGRKQVTLQEMTRFLSAATLVLSGVGVPLAVGLGLAVRGDLLAGATPTGIVIAALTIPFALVGQMAAALLFRLGALRTYGWVVALSGALQLCLVVVLRLTYRLDPTIALLTTLIVMAATGIALTVALAHHVGLGSLRPRTSTRVAREAIGAGLKLHMSSIALYLNLQVDLLFVSAMTDARNAGLYSLAAMLASTVFLATSTIGLSALQTQTDAKESLAVAYTIEFTRQSFGISLIVAAAAALVGYPLVAVVYGDEWVASVPSFMILTVAAVGLGIEAPTRNLLIRIGNPGTISMAAAAALAVNIVVNFTLIPVIGIMGAALASVLSYWTAALLTVWLVRKVAGVPMRRILAWPDLGEAVNQLAGIFRRTSTVAGAERVEPPLL